MNIFLLGAYGAARKSKDDDDHGKTHDDDIVNIMLCDMVYDPKCPKKKNYNT